MTFLELCKAVRRDSGITGIGPAQVTGQTGILEKVVCWVAQAYEDVQTSHTDWTFMWKSATANLVKNRRVYLAGDLNILDYKKIKLVHINNVKVHIKNWDWYSRYVVQGGLSVNVGTPTHIIIGMDKKIHFYPIPNGVSPVYIEYYRNPAKLVESTDQPIFPEQFHRAILHKALMYHADYEDDDYRFNKASLEYERFLTNMSEDSLPKVSFK